MLRLLPRNNIDELGSNLNLLNRKIAEKISIDNKEIIKAMIFNYVKYNNIKNRLLKSIDLGCSIIDSFAYNYSEIDKELLYNSHEDSLLWQVIKHNRYSKIILWHLSDDIPFSIEQEVNNKFSKKNIEYFNLKTIKSTSFIVQNKSCSDELNKDFTLLLANSLIFNHAEKLILLLSIKDQVLKVL